MVIEKNPDYLMFQDASALNMPDLEEVLASAMGHSVEVIKLRVHDRIVNSDISTRIIREFFLYIYKVNLIYKFIYIERKNSRIIRVLILLLY